MLTIKGYLRINFYNAVGYTNGNLTFKRFYHSSCGDLRKLYRNRIAPVMEFSDHVLFTCTDLLN